MLLWLRRRQGVVDRKLDRFDLQGIRAVTAIYPPISTGSVTSIPGTVLPTTAAI